MRATRIRAAVFCALALLLAARRAGADPDSGRDGRIGGFSVRADMERILSARSAVILAIGSAATAIAFQVEDADAQAEALAKVEVVGDVGNVCGSPLFVLGEATALVLAGRLADRPGLTNAGVDVARALAYSSVVVATLKVTVDRTRPDGERYSFPSAHTAAAFSAAPVIHQHFGRVAGATAYAIGAAAAVGRMRDRKHYLSDVVFGATIGFAVGDAIAGLRRDRAGHVLIEPGRVGVRVGF